ncbi:MAG: hypothetical protein ACRC0Q_06605 [Kurthia gibsonii]
MEVKKIVISVAATAGIILSGLTVHAATGSYSGKVPILNDLESTSVKKVSTKTTATNSVSKIQRGKLISWVEQNGANMTNQVGYTTTGTKTMYFYANGIKVGSGMNLNISTSPTTLENVDTAGTWTPN